MIAFYYVILLVSSGLIARFLVPSFSWYFLTLHLAGLVAVSFVLVGMTRFLPKKTISRNLQRKQFWFIGGVFSLSQAWYFWTFDWSSNTQLGEPIVNSGNGFISGLALCLFGVIFSIYGFQTYLRATS